MKSFDLESRVLAYEPSVVNAGRFVFLLTLAPSDCNMNSYVHLLKSKGVSHLIQRTLHHSVIIPRGPGSRTFPCSARTSRTALSDPDKIYRQNN